MEDDDSDKSMHKWNYIFRHWQRRDDRVEWWRNVFLKLVIEHRKPVTEAAQIADQILFESDQRFGQD